MSILVFIKKKNDNLFIGNKEVKFAKDAKDEKFIIIDEGDYPKKFTPGLWKLLSTKEYDEKNPIYNAADVQNYRDILVKTNTMYVGNKKESGKLKSKPKGMSPDKWKLINSTWQRQEVQEKLKKKEKKGSGVKKVVIPSDPNALLEKLDLLMASKEAGNTGVRNELVRVCDKLKRQGVFDSNIYKKQMSVL